jgi:ABC-type nitrate/sulfonate/bicarbonate transport system substrate-binding protein
MINSFEKKKLDAAFIWEPQLSDTEKKFGLHRLFDTSDIKGLSLAVFPFKRQFIKDHPETVQAVVTVWKKTTDYMSAHMEETYRIISEYNFANKPGSFYSYDEVEQLAKLDRFFGLKENLKAFDIYSGFESIYGNIQKANSYLLEYKGLTSLPYSNGMVNDDFIRNISQ